MKKIYLAAWSVSLMLSIQVSFAQSATDPNGTHKAKSNSSQIIIEQPVQSASANYDKRVPSAYQFLIEFCETKEGHYYLPKKKFLELTLQQQDYIQHKQTLFIIEE